jgi:uncharacterized metal-binding protein
MNYAKTFKHRDDVHALRDLYMRSRPRGEWDEAELRQLNAAVLAADIEANRARAAQSAAVMALTEEQYKAQKSALDDAEITASRTLDALDAFGLSKQDLADAQRRTKALLGEP